ncbi:CLUMA_CG010649, isoform A [Clunio marinus]|uniref:CLUMA_CG010649, isoform A n=1 Tax=Clunio marinus TaxID=568069 RepID=A0A1J1IAE0_9DIPT|nr:CLUMA_CG010649, isoform A [Clunio marinus]
MELTGKFKNCIHKWNKFECPYYTCIILSPSIATPYTFIKKINGHHLEAKSDKDVIAVIFKNLSVTSFPKGLGTIFQNLKIVQISDCGLKSITQRDLDGLTNIETLFCDRNKITVLPHNLFRDMNKLTHISFYKNHLNSTSSELLMPVLKNGLKLVDFRYNRSINAFYQDSTLKVNYKVPLTKLIALMDEKKKYNKTSQTIRQRKDLNTEVLNQFWTTGLFSDITIISDTEKFKAHKIVLAMQSSVFTSIFEDIEKYQKLNEIQMKEINSDVVKIFLKFLYTGEFQEEEEAEKRIKFSTNLKIYHLACNYHVSFLKDIVEEMIIENLKDDDIKNEALNICESTFVTTTTMSDVSLPQAMIALINDRRNSNMPLKKRKINQTLD